MAESATAFLSRDRIPRTPQGEFLTAQQALNMSDYEYL